MAGLIKRGDIYYAVYQVNGKERRKSLQTDVFRIAKANLSELEGSLNMGEDSPFPIHGVIRFPDRRQQQKQLLSFAQQILHEASRYKRPFTVAFLDLDNFKQVNDRKGHLEGDKALKLVADDPP